MKYPNQMTVLSVSFVIAGASTGGASGAVIINVKQVGPNVEIVGTGGVDLNSTVGPGVGSSATQIFNARNDLFVGVFPDPSDSYAVNSLAVVGPASTSNPGQTVTAGNPTMGFFVNNLTDAQSEGKIFVPAGYVSNAPLDFTASIDNYDFTDFGFSNGDSLVVSWSNGNFSESVTMNFIPEPSSALLLGFCALGLFGRRRKR